jgi:hypothetical protein
MKGGTRMSTMTPPGPQAAAVELVERPKSRTLFESSRKLRTVELDGYVDERGVRHTMLAVFGDGTDPPLRWRVLDAVLVAETVVSEPLEHAAHIAAIYVNEQSKEGPR